MVAGCSMEMTVLWPREAGEVFSESITLPPEVCFTSCRDCWKGFTSMGFMSERGEEDGQNGFGKKIIIEKNIKMWL